MEKKNAYLRFIEATAKTRASAEIEMTTPATAPTLPAEPEKEIVVAAADEAQEADKQWPPAPSWSTTTNMENDPHPEVVMDKDDELADADEE